MKKLLGLFISAFIILTAMSGCSQKSVVVASDQNLDVAEFDEYSTFTFASHIEDEDNNSYFLESETMKAILKEEVKEEMQALGYEYISGPDADADLLVNFQILKEDTEFTGWIPDGTDYWSDFGERAIDRDLDDIETYHLDKGSIIIHLADAEKATSIWRGYATGIVNKTYVTNEEEARIDEAVEKIFQNYNYTASR